MVCNPDVMRKAQEEIDRVVGRKRLPTFEDRANMPYFRAVIREVSLAYRISIDHPLKKVL